MRVHAELQCMRQSHLWFGVQRMWWHDYVRLLSIGPAMQCELRPMLGAWVNQ